MSRRTSSPDRMASQLVDKVVPNLRFDPPDNSMGIFVVGTYGTGKTHLMSLIAAVAEFPELREVVRHAGLASAFEPISGRFQVIRFDIGASAMSLRDIVCTELTKGLKKPGSGVHLPAYREGDEHQGLVGRDDGGLRGRAPRPGSLVRPR